MNATAQRDAKPQPLLESLAVSGYDRPSEVFAIQRRLWEYGLLLTFFNTVHFLFNRKLPDSGHL